MCKFVPLNLKTSDMIIKLFKTSKIFFAAIAWCACVRGPKNGELKEVEYLKAGRKTGSIMTEHRQKSLTPDEVLKEFKEGNNRFKNGDITLR